MGTLYRLTVTSRKRARAGPARRQGGRRFLSAVVLVAAFIAALAGCVVSPGYVAPAPVVVAPAPVVVAPAPVVVAPVPVVVYGRRGWRHW